MGIFDAFKRGAQQGYESGRRIQPRVTMNWDAITKTVAELWCTERFSYIVVRSSSTGVEYGRLEEARDRSVGVSGAYYYIVQCKPGAESLAEPVAEQIHSML
ncbi:MAG: hypothetical protein U0520_04410 [Candidatus Saccharimonadales bacterium]